MSRFAIVLAALTTACATTSSIQKDVAASSSGFCRPSDACWPKPDEWQALRKSLVGQLEENPSPLQPCATDASSPACADALGKMKNPYYLQDQAGGTESLGWLGAWTAASSTYAVAAETPSDIQAAVNFARDHRLKLVIKGTGHDYLGRSNAPDSLLAWTHKMRKVTVQDNFVAQGCPATAGVPAVTVEAGTRWLEVYDAVTVKHHRYVQGGGCTSVGAAGGFMQGGGFGSWSKKYGIAAASMLEAEIVTADGQLLVANKCQHSDLFWALRGGGGGTFGVVTKVTLMTHPLPNYFGAIFGGVKAKSDAAFLDLLEHFLDFYSRSLNNDSWGEQVRAKGDNSLRVAMNFLGMSKEDALKVWAPFRAWVEQYPDEFTIELDAVAIPAEKMWDASFFKEHLASQVEVDKRDGATGDFFWWKGDGDQVATYWYAYQSRWIPLDRMKGPQMAVFAKAMFDASRHWSVALHFNKGQSGAAADAIERDRETSMNPGVLDAAALAIIAASGTGYPGVHGREPDGAKGEEEKKRVEAAMKIIRDATPGAGSYVNETDYFEPNWQQSFWGDNYPKLLAIKHKYDPNGMFVCHHCVGSETPVK